MNFWLNLSPVAAVVLGQADTTSALTVYGPLGIICVWLMYRDEKRSRESESLRQTIADVAHEMRGVNLNLLMVQAEHGPEGLRQLARAELERKMAGKK